MKAFCLHSWITKLLPLIVLLCLLLLYFVSIPEITVRADSSSIPHASFAPLCVPTITLTSIPPFGSFENLFGRVDCATPADFKVAVYIYVSGWWIKPYFDHPLTPINNNGTWETDITTGGVDQFATKIAVFLLPNGTNPISPAEDSLNSVAHIIIDRYRTIEFSGYTWNVKSSEAGTTGPGPNYFSADVNDVWVDGNGNLHLTIKHKNDRWYSTEVFTQAPLGYGTYTFVTASRIDQLDKNAVLGLFTWDDNAPGNNYREIDIEFSRWGDALNQNSQYVVQPWNIPCNMHRFETTLEGSFSTHSFNWQSDRIFFSSYQGTMPNVGNKIESWLYLNSECPYVPSEGKGNARINLWLNNGMPPSDGQEIEIVIKAFSHHTFPVIASITRADPSPTNAATASFTVILFEPVSGVDASDFKLNTNLFGASIIGVSGSGNTYAVTVNTGSGNGSLRLDVIDDDSIMNASTNPLGGKGLGNGNFTTGEAYIVLKSSPPAPVLLSPKNNYITNLTTPTFSWVKTPFADHYEICFAGDSAFKQNLVCYSVTGTTFTPSIPFTDGTYYWRVIAYNFFNQFSNPSTSRKFTIDITKPSAPVLIYPPDGASVRNPVKFMWSRVGDAMRYEFQVDTDIGFSPPLVMDVFTRSNFYYSPALPLGTYYWHVRAQDAAGNWSDWSTRFTVTIAR